MLLFLHLGSLLAVEFGTQWHLRCTKKDVVAAVIYCQLFRPGLVIVVSHHCYCFSSISAGPKGGQKGHMPPRSDHKAYLAPQKKS